MLPMAHEVHAAIKYRSSTASIHVCVIKTAMNYVN